MARALATPKLWPVHEGFLRAPLCPLSGVKRTQITHAPRHICALAKNRLTPMLRSSFLVFGYPQSIAECSLGRGPTPAGWGTIAIERRWSRWIGVFLFWA